MRVCVISAVYNEEENISRLLDSLLNQSRVPDEIIIVDDGSEDATSSIVKACALNHPIVRYIFQENQGPAAARNKAWKSTNTDICLFTDGDCVPEPVWVEAMLKPFSDPLVGASAGTYKTLNPGSLLARFIGLEIAWRYRNVAGEVDAHGSYSLGIRKKVLQEIGGYKEDYKKPSGEDWDLTYKISRRYKIIFTPKAVVGHYHPESFTWYFNNQARRGYDRMRVYKDHSDKRGGDTYTGAIVKYQVAGAALFIASVPLLHPAVPFGWLLSVLLAAFLFVTTWIPFGYYASRDLPVAFASILIQFVRFFAWMAGGLAGFFQFNLLQRRRQ